MLEFTTDATRIREADFVVVDTAFHLHRDLGLGLHQTGSEQISGLRVRQNVWSTRRWAQRDGFVVVNTETLQLQNYLHDSGSRPAKISNAFSRSPETVRWFQRGAV